MEVGRSVDLKKIDASVKNRFSWHWLDVESKDNVRSSFARTFISVSGAKSYWHPCDIHVLSYMSIKVPLYTKYISCMENRLFFTISV